MIACWRCGTEWAGTVFIREGRTVPVKTPNVGDVFICAHCAAVGRFGIRESGALYLPKPSPAMMSSLLADPLVVRIRMPLLDVINKQALKRRKKLFRA